MSPKSDERAPESPRLTAQDGVLVADGEAEAGPSIARRYLGRSLEVLLYWMPVWIPLFLLAQLSSGGLAPALEERERLEVQEERLQQRLASDQARSRELELAVEAFEDEIYHERLLRKFRDEVRQEIEVRDLAPRVPEALPAGAGE